MTVLLEYLRESFTKNSHYCNKQLHEMKTARYHNHAHKVSTVWSIITNRILCSLPFMHVLQIDLARLKTWWQLLSGQLKLCWYAAAELWHYLKVCNKNKPLHGSQMIIRKVLTRKDSQVGSAARELWIILLSTLSMHSIKQLIVNAWRTYPLGTSLQPNSIVVFYMSRWVFVNRVHILLGDRDSSPFLIYSTACSGNNKIVGTLLQQLL